MVIKIKVLNILLKFEWIDDVHTQKIYVPKRQRGKQGGDNARLFFSVAFFTLLHVSVFLPASEAHSSRTKIWLKRTRLMIDFRPGE